MAYFRKGSLDEAVKAFEKSKELAVYAGWAESALGIIALARGERQKAEKILEEMLEQKKKANVSATCIAFLYGALGSLDEAFEFLEQACAERDSVLAYVHLYARILSPRIAEDPRFKTLLKKMDLAQ